jgi:hypothetical protein
MWTKSKLRLPSSNSKFRPDSGFTLTDLLISAGLTAAVITAAGTGMAAMIESSTVANSKSERSTELNRSLDFISNEVRQASSIVANAEGAANPSGPIPGSTTTWSFSPVGSSATKVLMATLPGASAPVVYYIATPPANSWAGPKVVYRWGPKFNARGGYEGLANPATWESLPVIEKIQASDASGNTAAPACGSGLTLSGAFGFSACVNSSGTVAEIYQTGRINKVLGRGDDLKASMKVSTRNTDVAFTQPTIPSGAIAASLPAVSTPSPTGTSNPTGGGGCNNGVGNGSDGCTPGNSTSKDEPLYNIVTGALECTPATGNPCKQTSTSVPSYLLPAGVVPKSTPTAITVVTGEVKVPQTSTMLVKVLGGAITCGASGPSIPTSAQLIFSGGTSTTQTMSTAQDTSVTKVVSPNTTLTITGTSGPYCVSISANSKTSNGKQVYTLKNGETVPNFKPFANQKSIQTILTSASTNPLTGKPILNGTTGKVTLAPNQAIYLYELGTTSKTSSAYDLQDLVILATVTPN